jgi:1-acyl-sn-glycerol-3-phosphate acyltransferase
MLLILRSLLFNIVFFLGTAALAIGAVPFLFGPRRWVIGVMRIWAAAVTFALRWICDVRLVVTGREHLPAEGAALIAAKHQSALDTILWPGLVEDCCYVLKRELLRIPFYALVARRAQMIAVDRDAGASAMRHLLRSGRAAAAAGRQIVIFPEGTRVAPGERVPYQPGILALAQATGLPVIPAATDSGLLWARRSFLKRPGVITISILPPLPIGLPKAELLARLEAVIEAETDRLMAGRRVA